MKIDKKLILEYASYPLVGYLLYLYPMHPISKGIYILLVTWVLYLAIMNLGQAYARKVISHGALYFARPLLLVGLVSDIFSMLVMSLVLLDFPRILKFVPDSEVKGSWDREILYVPFIDKKLVFHAAEFLLTNKLDRIITEEETSLRGKVAELICSKLLNNFDPNGVHCGGKKKLPLT